MTGREWEPNRPTTLTIRQRSCLLRAARTRLAQLHEDYDSLSERGDIGNKLEELSAELGCIAAGIQWLWQQPAQS